MARPAFKPVKRQRPDTVATVIAKSYTELGGAKRVSAHLGVRKSAVYSYADQDDSGRRISHEQVCDLVRAGAVAPVEHLAALAGGHFVPGRIPKDTLLGLMARSSRDHGDLVARILVALEDRKLTAAECAELLAEFDDLVEILVGARNRIRQGKP